MRSAMSFTAPVWAAANGVARFSSPGAPGRTRDEARNVVSPMVDTASFLGVASGCGRPGEDGQPASDPEVRAVPRLNRTDDDDPDTGPIQAGEREEQQCRHGSSSTTRPAECERKTPVGSGAWTEDGGVRTEPVGMGLDPGRGVRGVRRSASQHTARYRAADHRRDDEGQQEREGPQDAAHARRARRRVRARRLDGRRAQTYPSRYSNLKAAPDAVTIQDGAEPFAVEVRELSGDERAVWWERAAAAYPPYHGTRHRRPTG